jgi:hypothetical protein
MEHEYAGVAFDASDHLHCFIDKRRRSRAKEWRRWDRRSEDRDDCIFEKTRVHRQFS